VKVGVQLPEIEREVAARRVGNDGTRFDALQIAESRSACSVSWCLATHPIGKPQAAWPADVRYSML
jgi:hypothetical protein